jgi:hypothetical protein
MALDLLFVESEKLGQVRGNENGLLVRNKDLEGTNDLCQWGALIRLPLLESLHVVDKDNEVVFLALEVDLGLLCFSSRHDCVLVGCW